MSLSRLAFLPAALVGLSLAAHADRLPWYDLSFGSEPQLVVEPRSNAQALHPTSDELPLTTQPGNGLAALPLNASGRWTVGLLADPWAAAYDVQGQFNRPFVSYELDDAWTTLVMLNGGCGTAPGSSAPAGVLLFRPLAGSSSTYLGGSLCYHSDGLLSGAGQLGVRIGITIQLP